MTYLAFRHRSVIDSPSQPLAANADLSRLVYWLRQEFPGIRLRRGKTYPTRIGQSVRWYRMPDRSMIQIIEAPNETSLPEHNA